MQKSFETPAARSTKSWLKHIPVEEHGKFSVLEKIGILEWTADNRLVFHAEKFDNPLTLEIIHNAGNRKGLSSAADIIDFLKGQAAFSPDDYNRYRQGDKNVRPRPILYEPRSIEDAFNPEKIAADDSMIRAWDISPATAKLFEEVTLDDGSTVRGIEEYLAYVIYHDLHGHRDETGKLFLKDPESEQQVAFSFQKLLDLSQRNISLPQKTGEKRAGFFDAPRKNLTAYCQNLLRTGIVRITDAEQMSIGPTAEIIRTERNTSNKGEVFLEGMKLNLGSRYANKKIVALEPGQYGIINNILGHDDLIATFRLPNPEAVAKRKEEVIAKFQAQGRPTTAKYTAASMYFKQNEIAVTDYSQTERSHPLPNETPEEYARRILRIKNWPILEKLSKDLSSLGIGIHTLPLKEQEWLTAAAPVINENYSGFLRFAQMYGLPGLRSFLSGEFSPTMAKTILSLGKHEDPTLIKQLFDTYAKIVDAAEGAADVVKDATKKDSRVTPLHITRIQQSLLKRASQLLTDVAANKTETNEDLLAQLQAMQTDVLVVAHSFRTLHDNGLVKSLEDFAGIGMETKKGTEISRAEQEKMLALAAQNYAQQPSVKKLVLETLQKKFASAETLFAVAKNNESIIGFLRLEEQPDGVLYAGSFNVHPDARGNKLGETLLAGVLTEVSKNHLIRANAQPSAAVTGRYIGDFGFVATGVTTLGGAPSFNLELNKENNAQYQFLGAPLENLLRQWRNNDYSLSDPVIFLKFPPTFEEHMLSELKKITSNGFVITALRRDPLKNYFLVLEKTPTATALTAPTNSQTQRAA